MIKIFEFLTAKFKYILIIYLLSQVLLLLKFPVSYNSDSNHFYFLAQECLTQNSWYPLPSQLYENYTSSPVYINLTILALHIYNSTISIGIMNIILNTLQIFILYMLVKQIFIHYFQSKYYRRDILPSTVTPSAAAKAAVLLYMLYMNNMGMILFNLTEITFTVLVSASIYFFLRRNPFSFFLAGILCGNAIGTRPVGWSLAAAFLIIFIYLLYQKEIKVFTPALLIAGILSAVTVNGLITKHSSGEFIYAPHTGPVNLIMGANDKTTGGYKAALFDEPNSGYIPGIDSLKHWERQAIWRERSIKWIKLHPVKWISMFPVKAALMFGWDDITISKFFYDDYHLLFLLKEIKERRQFGMKTDSRFILWILVMIIHHLFYFTAMIFFAYGMIKYRGSIFRVEGLNLLLLYTAGGLMLTLIAVGVPRYKYPYMFVFFIFDAVFILKFLYRKKDDRIYST